jgi:glycolate oxidase
MSLSKEIYLAMQDVVGKENISDDPAVLHSYMSMRCVIEGRYETSFEAIVLPKDTLEVQAVVRLCNKYKTKFKASSTSWLYSDPSGSNCIKLDLRRMNHILEINEKNMYAVVEPHVIYAQLQAELMKKGLNCNVTGAGSNCSALPIAAHANLGHLSESSSYGERNLLGVEWVTPDGEIVRLGAPGSSEMWFCGDGPGPSLRGIIRGNCTPLGGLGVFTKAAQKIYHWPGPATFPMEGTSPDYAMNEIPERFLIRYFSFPNLENLIDAVRKIGESEIGFVVMGFNVAMLSANLTSSNQGDADLIKKLSGMIQGPGFVLVIAGNTSSDFDFKKAVLQMIINETQGKSLEMIEDPKIGSGLLWSVIRISRSIREVGRAGGGGMGVVGGTDVFPLMTHYIQELSKLKADLIARGLIFNETTDPFVQSIEHGHLGHGEMLARFSGQVSDPKQVEETIWKVSNQIAIEQHFGVPHQVWSDKLHDWYGPNASNYHKWLRSIKRTFDPNGASESTNYISNPK